MLLAKPAPSWASQPLPASPKEHAERAPGLQRGHLLSLLGPQDPSLPRFCHSGTRGKRPHRGDLGLYGLCCRRVKRLRSRTPKPGQMTFMMCIQSLGLLLTFDYGEILHKHLPPWNTDSTSAADDGCLFNPPIHSSSCQLASVTVWPGELLSPCRCDGSVKCTHQPCLIKWISERGCWSCELCYYKYHVIAISTKNPLQGPSVYRIFKRWQAVNQQWKVLNYDKAKDLEEQKTGGRTNPRTSSSTQANAPSSEEEAAGTPAPEEGPARAAGHPSGPLSDHHCAYTILHILSHLRPHEQRTPQGGSREVVMRVTTV
ncbi:hypothetical protein FD755_008149 [Muntiacus reevesi]|uniref:RING-type E3 ubiquitin transferase n=1 Tax=Muntiacus reevesi TaxID=9886 RepID=A0A5J5MIV4_MUNRE|nr:hypothetical protein FD755_008149 [Muntiacus reevesi]